MGIPLVPEPKGGVKALLIILGSSSDWPIVGRVIHSYGPEKIRLVVHAISCHRNFKDIFQLASCRLGDLSAIIGAGSKALALPGILDAAVYAFDGHGVNVIGVALGEPGSEALLAAKLSIGQLPGTPVLMDASGRPYEGPEGMKQAIDRVIAGDLPEFKARTLRPPQFGMHCNFDPDEE